MRCAGCGEPATAQHSFCPHCGTRLQHDLEETAPAATSSQLVYQRIGKGPLQLLDPGHHYGQSTEDSCVDLFLTDYPPAIFQPTTFGELPPQVGYCLGRCAQPPIVNTGGG